MDQQFLIESGLRIMEAELGLEEREVTKQISKAASEDFVAEIQKVFDIGKDLKKYMSANEGVDRLEQIKKKGKD